MLSAQGSPGTTWGSSASTEDTIDKDTVLQLGAHAYELLEDGRLGYFLNEMQTDIAACLFNTAPAHTKERESLYFQHKAVEDLKARLQTYINSAKAIRDAEDEEAAKDASEPENE